MHLLERKQKQNTDHLETEMVHHKITDGNRISEDEGEQRWIYIIKLSDVTDFGDDLVSLSFLSF